MEMNRRSLITGLMSFVAAPAIVRASSLMPINSLLMPFPDSSHWEPRHWEYFNRLVNVGMQTMREHFDSGIDARARQFCELSAWVGTESQISIENILASYLPVTVTPEQLDKIYGIS